MTSGSASPCTILGQTCTLPDCDRPCDDAKRNAPRPLTLADLAKWKTDARSGSVYPATSEHRLLVLISFIENGGTFDAE